MPDLIDRNVAIDKMCGDCKSGYDGNCPHPLGMCHELESLFLVPTVQDIDRATILRLCNEIENIAQDIKARTMSDSYFQAQCIIDKARKIGKELTGSDGSKTN